MRIIILIFLNKLSFEHWHITLFPITSPRLPLETSVAEWILPTSLNLLQPHLFRDTFFPDTWSLFYISLLKTNCWKSHLLLTFDLIWSSLLCICIILLIDFNFDKAKIIKTIFKNLGCERKLNLGPTLTWEVNNPTPGLM